jgi:hypothetical protein
MALPLCHPERNRGICSSADRGIMGLHPTQGDEKRFLSSNRTPWKHGPPPLSSRATALHGSVALPFVIPSVAEGSAVQRTFPGNVFRPKLPQNRHPERSASQIYRVTQRLMARSRRACPERSRGNPEGAYLTHAALSFSTTESREQEMFFDRGMMGQRPTQGDEERPLSSNRTPWNRRPPLLSSRAQPRDLQFSGPFVEMFFVKTPTKSSS